MKKQIIILLALFPIVLLSQSSQFMRMQRYGPAGLSYAADIMELPDGDIVMAGRSYRCVGSTCNSASGLVRTDPEGNFRWFTKIGDAGANMNPVATCMGNDGNLMFLGYFGGDAVFSKIDTVGNIVWHSMLDASWFFTPTDVVAYDNAYFITGYWREDLDKYCFVARIEENGSLGWMKYFTIPNGRNQPECIQVNNAGELVIAGTHISSQYTLGLIFMDTQGNILDTWGYQDPAGSSFPFVEDLIYTSNGNYVLSFRGQGNWGNFCLMEIRGDGSIHWSKKYYLNQAPTQVVNIVEGHHGGYFAIGDRQFQSNNSSIMSMRIDDNGNVLHGKVIDNLDEDRSHELVQAQNCGYLMAGLSEGMGGTSSWMFARADSAGLTGMESSNITINAVNHPMDPVPYPVLPDSQVFTFSNPTFLVDHPTILMDSVFTYATTPSCTPITQLEAPDADPFSIAPNPVTDVLRVTYGKNHSSGPITYQLCDLQGKVLKSGGLSDTGVIQLESLPQGVYLLQFKAKNSVEWKRIVKQ